MNPLNYGSKEACQRLHDAGIVLETEFYWYHNTVYDTYEMKDKIPHYMNKEDYIPALSMAEVWRELPPNLSINKIFYEPQIRKINEVTYVGYYWFDRSIQTFLNSNPTDALIDLLIWVRKEKV